MSPLTSDPTPEPKAPTDQSLSTAAMPTHDLKIYHGCRNRDGVCDVWVVDDPTNVITQEGINDAAARDLPLRLDRWNHSPTGFEWGYGGSGPAQLALALLADALREDQLARNYHQEFKWKVISQLPDSWTLTASEVRKFVATLQQENSSPENET
jgi:hypothetical protein